MLLEQQYFNLFAGLPRAHGVYELAPELAQPGKKQEGRAYTTMGTVTPELWRKHLAGEQGLGVVPIRDDGTVRFGAIDVDVYNLDLAALEKSCVGLGLPLLLCRTKSGGAHLYLFCREDISAALVTRKLAEWATALGHPGAEIFPKQTQLASENDVGNWINMPYFGGARTTRYAIKDGKAIDCEAFPAFAQGCAVTAEALESIKVATANGDSDFADGPPCLNSLAGQGMVSALRNSLLFNMGVYARMRHKEEWQPYIAAYNDKHMSPPLPNGEVRGIIKSLHKKDYFYTCQQAPIHSVCQKRECRKRKYGIGGLLETPDVGLDKLVKNLTVPVTWIAVMGEQRLELTTKELLSQTLFRERCAETLSTLPRILRQDTWDTIVRERMADADIVEVPTDASPEGQLMHHVENFCTSRIQARAKDELLQGKPWTEEGVTYFRAADLLRHLDQQHFRALNQRELWMALKRVHVKTHGFTLKGKKVTCWALPAFDEQTEEFDVPRTQAIEEF